jgi:hypothetical protein
VGWLLRLNHKQDGIIFEWLAEVGKLRQRRLFKSVSRLYVFRNTRVCVRWWLMVWRLGVKDTAPGCWSGRLLGTMPGTDKTLRLRRNTVDVEPPRLPLVPSGRSEGQWHLV